MNKLEAAIETYLKETKKLNIEIDEDLLKKVKRVLGHQYIRTMPVKFQVLIGQN